MEAILNNYFIVKIFLLIYIFFFVIYYYIFKNEEIIELFEKIGLKLISHQWNHGNEIFILET